MEFKVTVRKYFVIPVSFITLWASRRSAEGMEMCYYSNWKWDTIKRVVLKRYTSTVHELEMLWLKSPSTKPSELQQISLSSTYTTPFHVIVITSSCRKSMPAFLCE